MRRFDDGDSLWFATVQSARVAEHPAHRDWICFTGTGFASLGLDLLVDGCGFGWGHGTIQETSGPGDEIRLACLMIVHLNICIWKIDLEVRRSTYDTAGVSPLAHSFNSALFIPPTWPQGTWLLQVRLQ